MKIIWLGSVLLAATSAVAQTAPVEQAAAPAAPAATEETKAAEPVPAPVPAKAWYEKVKLEGMIDGYYSYRVQGTPSDKTNELRAYDGLNNTFTVGYAKVALSLPAEPAGFRLDVGFGPTADINGPDSGNTKFEVLKNIQQAYATVKLFNVLTVDLGKFNTSAGAEVIEANGNWLQSRSMIFNYGPFTHAGLRLSMPIGDVLTVQAGIVNGWDTVFSAMSWKTFNVSGVLNLSTGTSVALNFYGGPQTTPEARLLVDLVVNQTLGDKAALNLNAIFGAEGASKWYAASLMGKYMITDAIRIAARVEYFADPDGHRLSVAGASYLSATLGAGFLFSGPGNLELRPEIRHDQALTTTPFVGGTSASQTTFSLAAVAWF